MKQNNDTVVKRVPIADVKEQVRRKKVHGEAMANVERQRIVETIRNFPLASDFGKCEVTPCRECNACENLKAALIEMIQKGTRLTTKPTLQLDENGDQEDLIKSV